MVKFFLLSCMLMVSGCYDLKNIDEKTASQYYANNNSSFNDKKEHRIFYVSDDNITKPKDFSYLEPVIYGKLVVKNNCLSFLEILDDGKEEFYTLVIPKDNSIVFNEKNKIIGIKNKKRDKVLFIEDYISASGIASVSNFKFNIDIPNECPKGMMVTQEIY